MSARVAVLMALAAVLGGCPPATNGGAGGGSSSGTGGGEGGGSADAGLGTSARSDLRWKRFRTLQHDLAQGLELADDQVCSEVGGRPCATAGFVMLTDILKANGASAPAQSCAFLQGTSTCQDAPIYDLMTPKGVHALSLGGNDPFLGETFDPLADPGVTTPIALDRLVLQACGQRVQLDLAGNPKVFTHVDLHASSLSPGSAGVRDEIASLYQRLLSRDPKSEEIDTVAGMLDGTPAMDGATFARLACYAIATTTEEVFQ